MTVVVYTIALNEEKNAEAFMQNCADADLVVIGDTGCTDKTAEIVQDMGGKIIPIRVHPWRFDMPRNALLSILPENVDVCMPLDLDERMCDGWRNIIETNWKPGEHHRLRFRYVHSFNPDMTPAGTGMKDFAHARFNYIWKHAVHENVYYIGDEEENVLTLHDLVVEHHQDAGKERRNSYTKLLELECRSETCTPRHIFWLAREYIYKEEWKSAKQACLHYLEQPDKWYVEEAHVYRYLAKAEANLQNGEEAFRRHLDSIRIAPKEREMWLDLARYHFGRKQYTQALAACETGLQITKRPDHYLTTSDAWGFMLYELAALSATGLELKELAGRYIKSGIKVMPLAEDRLKSTADRYKIKY